MVLCLIIIQGQILRIKPLRFLLEQMLGAGDVFEQWPLYHTVRRDELSLREALIGLGVLRLIADKRLWLLIEILGRAIMVECGFALRPVRLQGVEMAVYD